MLPIDSINELSLPKNIADATTSGMSEIERDVLSMFGEFRNPLLRYALSFGICMHDAEEVIQEVFLSLFRHLQQGRSRKNLRGWIFRVTHNLALKQRYADLTARGRIEQGDAIAERQIDPSPSPEEHLSEAQRRRHLLAVVHALGESDRNCLLLRAEGLRYREIAQVLGVSLGSISISLTRSIARLMRADGR